MSAGVLDRTGSSKLLSDFDWTTDELREHSRQSHVAGGIASSVAPTVIRFGDGVIEFAEEPPEWARKTIEYIAALGDLAADWDSYGARPIDPHCAIAAITLVLSAFDPTVPTPSVVPTNRGGVQLEWHKRGVDLEIEIESPSRLRIAFYDRSTGEELADTLTDDLQRLLPLLARISVTD